MAEWSNAAVLKTVVRSHVPGVRIPLSPPNEKLPTQVGSFVFRQPSQACLSEGWMKTKI